LLNHKSLEKGRDLQDIEGNWHQIRSEPKFMQFVIEIDESRLRAMGLDFIEVKDKIDKDGSQIVQAVMFSRSENLDVDSLVRTVSELRLQTHPKGDIYLRDVAKVYAELADEEPANDASPISVQLR
jgi:multidrug efflux pump subunit AcrB